MDQLEPVPMRLIPNSNRATNLGTVARRWSDQMDVSTRIFTAYGLLESVGPYLRVPPSVLGLSFRLGLRDRHE